MENLTPPLGIIERFNRWLQESIMVKLASIGFLVIILLIPGEWIDHIIEERQDRSAEMIREVSDKWSGPQTLSGPILVVPFVVKEVIDLGKDGKEIREHLEKAYFLPQSLQVTGVVTPEKLSRGLFDAVVYQSALNINATFQAPDFKNLAATEDAIQWQDAYLVFGITDVRGISDSLSFQVNGKSLTAEPSSNIGVKVSSVASSMTNSSYENPAVVTHSVAGNGIIVKVPATGASDFVGKVDIALKLKGSERLYFTPVGKSTTVRIEGPWADPSFDGEFLPEHREVTTDAFKAEWKVLHFNRPFPQQWKNGDESVENADFGVRLMVPVDQYQKSIRSSKYSVLVILLTFMALFLVEITQRVRIHPFQYILVGAALTIYYVLLLSISEHMGYNAAYLLASVATITLITFYSRTFLVVRRLVTLFSALLAVFYTFIFVIIQEQDYSLLIGSIGLFMIIGLLMYFSRKVRWYDSELKTGN
ncbi:MAG TPA: cell envelope integrity protein CreD [Chryseolinea sp.]|nr:cell envelope integrity protein CreD [Chryseolinea sp.]